MPSKQGSSDLEASAHDEKRAEEQHHGIKDRISHFTWSNFACTMSTGAIAVVLSQQPFQFDGLNVIGKAFFILDLVLLVAFMAAMVTRFILQPWKVTKSLHYPKEALFFGSFWYCTLFVAERIPVSTAMPALVFPVYPSLVIGPLAASILPSQPQKASLPIFIGGVLFQGLGWVVAMFMYSVYIIRLLANDLPPPSSRPGMFISVGPAGYTSAALVALGNHAPHVVPQNFLNLPNFDVGAAIKVVGVMSGIFVWSVAFWFFALTLVTILHGAKKMSFTLSWWAFIFPNAGLTLATIQIGRVLDSKGINAVSSAMTVLLIMAWLFTAGSYIVAVVRKQVYWTGKDEDHGMDDNGQACVEVPRHKRLRDTGLKRKSARDAGFGTAGTDFSTSLAFRCRPTVARTTIPESPAIWYTLQGQSIFAS
ncbi:hypothetical protein LTR70_003737 [Exophiala xenobiotica]|uniref:Malic acid transport protein n=1 Tax=Lithohypha guttulata TaxID=1690604 RepID=A0ABR0KIE1_9EURO|nr:hypothetical protein LTR24_002303 [Lithohypha guttulata]KAK5322789.1 hypothetical protein LTR70_003737 [Exophiala xenobiotica]